MARLNSYIQEDQTYLLVYESEQFARGKSVHPSRLLNPAVFSLSESPIYENGVIDVGSLAMASKAYPFLNSFNSNHPAMIKNYLDSTGRDFFRSRLKINSDSEEVLRGVNTTTYKFAGNFAVITEYIIRKFPEDSRIIEKNWTRFNPYHWIRILEENNEDIGDWGFEVYEDHDGQLDTAYVADYEEFSPEKIPITEQQFLDHVSELLELVPKINFAVQIACQVLNLLNHKSFLSQLEEFEPDPEKWQLYHEEMRAAPEDSKGTAYCTRWFEATFRRRKFNYQKSIPRSPDHYTDLNKTTLPYLNFIKEDCRVLSEDLRNALKVLIKHDTSLRFKGKSLGQFKKCAEIYEKYLNARTIVIGWHQNRFNWVEDETMEKAMQFLLDNYSTIKDLADIRSKTNVTLFIADQRVIFDAKKKGEDLPTIAEIKNEMDAVEKLGPHLEKLGLKIVPMDYQDAAAKISEAGKEITANFSMASKKIRNAIVHGTNVPIKLPPEILWTSKSAPEPPSNVSVAALKPPKVSKESTDKFEEDYGYNQKVKKWKDTTTYKSFFDKLGGSGECSLVDIGLVKSNKTLLTDKEAAERVRIKQAGGKVTRGNKMTERSAANSGRNFVEEAELLPCRNFKNLSRTDAVLKVFEAAYKRKNKITGKSTKANDATALLSKDKDFLVTPDKVLTKHLKKLKVTEKQQTKYLEQVDEIEGTVEGTSNVKYNTEEVAIAFCEGQKKPSDSGQ